jgi:predicted SAM-dependent methyltransferase
VSARKLSTRLLSGVANTLPKVAVKLPYGLRLATLELHRELVSRVRHVRGRSKARNYRKATGLHLHLGSGGASKPGWLNVDLDPKADLMLDLREPVPFSDESAKIIYSEHVFEHFGYPEPIGALLRECQRILEPGGILTCAVPDGHLVLEHYLNNNHPEVEDAHKRSNPTWCKTPMDHVNYCFRLVDYSVNSGGEHKWYYDFDSLRQLLERSGFINITRRSFDPNLDQAEREIGSLYVECRKLAVYTASK